MFRDRARNLFLSLHPKDGTLSAAALVPLFRKSNLPTNLLREIWYLSDVDNKGCLNEEEFEGLRPTLEAADKAGIDEFPILEGITTAASVTQPPLLTTGLGSVWSISPNKKELFASTFFDLGPEGEYLDGLKARDSFMESGLPVDKLAQIWSLVDCQERGKLNLAEFLIAMHLIDLLRSVSQACGLPENITVQPGSQNFEHDWIPTPQQVEQIQSIFSELPKTAAGEVSAQDCVGHFTDSGLPKETLAQIWEFANVRDAEGLNSREFLVALLLIQGSLSGKLLPQVLPSSLREILQTPLEVAAPFELKDLGIQKVVVQPELISEAIVGDALDYTQETHTRLTTLLKELRDTHTLVQEEIKELEVSNSQKLSEVETLTLAYRELLQKNNMLQLDKQRVSSEVSRLNEEIEDMEAQCLAFQSEETNLLNDTEKLKKDSRIELGFLGYNLESAAKCHKEINSLLTQLGNPENPPPDFLA
ncbi:hypothetical protein L0F63_006005 [Massospora cicadina]|nr:hypothetical protein L0F63_006005 [Massospora cicadina]